MFNHNFLILAASIITGNLLLFYYGAYILSGGPYQIHQGYIELQTIDCWRNYYCCYFIESAESYFDLGYLFNFQSFYQFQLFALMTIIVTKPNQISSNPMNSVCNFKDPSAKSISHLQKIGLTTGFHDHKTRFKPTNKIWNKQMKLFKTLNFCIKL